MIQKPDYNIGLDIGTNSVGWAVTNQQNKLLKFKNKNMWGTRLFEEADTAASRRISRGSRRRYNRRRERIKHLDAIFMEEVVKVDPLFKERMQALSFLDKEDKEKQVNSKVQYNLFEDTGYTDKDFFKEFETIYHLRHALCNRNQKQDPRLLYLALHHIIKYRGNFLYEGQTFSMDNSDIVDRYVKTIETIDEILGLSITIENDTIYVMLDILKEDITASAKVSKLIALEPRYKGKEYKELFNLLVGNKCKLSTLCREPIIDENEKKIEISFRNSDYEDQKEKYSDTLGELMKIIDLAHGVYSWIVLQEILKKSNSISEAMIHKYKKHEGDLKKLKKVIQEYHPKKYSEIFRKEDKKGSYAAYINAPKDTTQEILCKEIVKILEQDKENEDIDYQYCLQEAQKGTLMPKQTSTDNGMIPYQMHEQELVKIIEKQSKYYPVLTKFESGETVSNDEKLKMLVNFRMPYYIGPISSNSEFAWAIRNKGYEKTRVTPWNLEEVINVDASAMEFITRMTNNCTYLMNEPVLPKKSLYVTKYEVYNELNTIRNDGNLLDKGLIHKIYDTLFMERKKVTKKHVEEFLKQEQIPVGELTGFQKDSEFASSLESWIDFKKIFGEITSSNIEMIENIILWLTVFEDKKICERKIRNEYEYSKITDKQCKEIIALQSRYTGWSRFSKKLLVGIRSNDKSILDILEETNLVFMQIITSKKYTFKDIIEEYGKKKVDTIDPSILKDVIGSPAIKKGIWQAIKIVDEITKVMKKKPKQIFIEFARDEQQKVRTSSRKQQLLTIYGNMKKEVSIYNAEIHKEIENRKEINQEKLFLYFIQGGKCMYSGKDLSIDKLPLYEVDHIIPRFLLKDDSIDNKVLVIAKENQRKKDDLTLNSTIIHNQISYWKKLRDVGAISHKKYNNLVRTEYSEKAVEGFINRQLVETRQISKYTLQILDNLYPNTSVKSIRAGLVSEFRHKYDVYKLRDLNDYHHAHDAYIITILGNYMSHKYASIYNGEFNQYKANFIKDTKLNERHSTVLSVFDKTDMIVDQDTGELLYQSIDISKIKQAFYYPDCFITKKLEPYTGELFKATIHPNHKMGKSKAKIPVNKNRADVVKYGGYSDVNNKYYYAIGYKKGKKYSERIVGIPSYMDETNKEELKHYLQEELKATEITIVRNKIYKNQLISIDGQLYYMSSAKELVNARQLIVSKQDIEILKQSYISIKRNKTYDINDQQLIDVFDHMIEKYITYYPGYRSVIEKLQEFREKFLEFPSASKYYFINELFKFSKASPVNPNFNWASSIKLSEEKIQELELTSKTLSDRLGRKSKVNINPQNTIFIQQSITGMYQKEVSYELKNSSDTETL